MRSPNNGKRGAMIPLVAQILMQILVRFSSFARLLIMEHDGGAASRLPHTFHATYWRAVAITEMMETQRPKWAIDLVLGGLIGQNVRVAAQAFSPVRWNGTSVAPVTPVETLLLPDNTSPSGLPVFFEGQLQQFERRIAVVFVGLEAIVLDETAAEGVVCFRGKTAVVLRGPAVVQLAFPFRVERLPAETSNYWRDLRFARAQLELPFVADG